MHLKLGEMVNFMLGTPHHNKRNDNVGWPSCGNPIDETVGHVEDKRIGVPGIPEEYKISVQPWQV